MGKFHQFLTVHNMSIFLFLDNNLYEYLWIFNKLAMCIDIVEICFGIANWQSLSIFDRIICLQYNSGGVLSFHVFMHPP